MLQVGHPAPSFSLPDASMEMMHLSSFRGKKNVVLYFYPRDGSPGCTIQSIDFSDREGVTALLSRIPRQVLYISIPLIVAIVLVLARFALVSGQNWLYPALWLGKEVLNFLITLVIWGVAGVVMRYPPGKKAVPIVQRQPDHGPGHRRICDRPAGGSPRH